MADYQITLTQGESSLHMEFGKALHNHYAYSAWRVPAGSDRTILLQDANQARPVSGEVVSVDTKSDDFDVRAGTLGGQTILIAFFAARYDGEPDSAAFSVPLVLSQGGNTLLDIAFPIAAADLLKSMSFSIQA